jgi:hypothetical protein
VNEKNPKTSNQEELPLPLKGKHSQIDYLRRSGDLAACQTILLLKPADERGACGLVDREHYTKSIENKREKCHLLRNG